MNETRLYFQAAIDYLMDPDSDFSKVAANLAKMDPELFCKAAGVEPLYMKVSEVYYTQGMVPAIKFHREQTGSTLVEAKAYVDAIRGAE